MIAREAQAEGIEMYVGWTMPFKVNRPLTQLERDQALPRAGLPLARPEQRGALVNMNSTYLDWIDRRFLYRGTMNTFLATLLILSMMPVLVLLNSMIFDLRGDEQYWWVLLFMMIPIYIMLWHVMRFIICGEYFSYVHWPIRFNRRTQMVHVFRHSGADGTLSVPWGQVYFHVGTGGKQHPNSIYIRGHILDGDIVKDTFALGHDVHKNEMRALLEMWEFIRCYMEEGPEAAGPGLSVFLCAGQLEAC
ncbi:DUF6708 domain-containing protein, partial [Cupriavidus sp. DL-D2]|uniref:DUF6708 domain-containing protein n=1 Tax=Cupriavidus sp. DL-D2 TaxID=3144974 RepID=UPI003215DDFE